MSADSFDRSSTGSVRSPTVWGGTWFLRALFLIVVLYWSVRTGRQAFHSLDHDFGCYYRAGLALVEGRNPYHVDHGPLLTFKYAPVIAVGFMPLASIDPVPARVLWCLMEIGALGVVFALSLELANVPKGRLGAVAFWSLWAVAGHAVAELHAGQTTTLWLAACLAAYRDMSRDRPAWAGFWLAWSIAFKLVPIALVPLYFWTRRPAAGLAWLGLWLASLAVAPSLVLGWEKNSFLLSEWPEHLAETTTVHQATRPQNQSVYAQLARWTGVGSADGASLQQVKLLWLGLAVPAALAMYGWIARLPKGSWGPAGYMTLLYMTVFNPLAWRYNFLALVPVYVWLIDRLWTVAGHRGVRGVLLAITAWFLTVPGPELLYEMGARLWATGLLVVLVAWTVRLESHSLRKITPLERTVPRAGASATSSSPGSVRRSHASGIAR